MLISEVCELTGISVVSTLNDQVVTRNLPSNLNEEDYGLFERDLQRKNPARSLFRVSEAETCGVEVIGRTLLGGNRPQLVVGNPLSPAQALYRPLRFAISSVRRRHNLLRGLWIADPLSHNYFHWLTEALPRLIWAREAGIQEKVIIPSGLAHRSFVKESLALLGEQPEIVPSSVRVSIGSVYLPELTAPSGNPHPELLRKTRDRLALGAGVDHSTVNSGGKKIWVRRGGTRKRHLRNQAQIESMLLSHGFEIFEPHLWSLRQQIQIFSTCNILAGVHGSGLSNMLFTRPESLIFEVRREGDSHNNCYFAMASALEHQYGYMLAGPKSLNNKKGLRISESKLTRELSWLLQN